MNTIPFMLLIIFSAFTMNLTLQCALGIKGAAESKIYCKKTILLKLLIVFVSIVILWLFFYKIISSLISGILIYVLLFPVSFLVYTGLELLIFELILKKKSKEECFVNFPEGIVAAALFICLNIASSFFEAIVLSFGFSAGVLLVYLIIREIRRRAALEEVPVFMRGKPLVLISMGMLSLVFSAGSLLLLRIFGAE